MGVYLLIVVGINFLVNLLLLIGLCRLDGAVLTPGRAAMASGLGAFLSGLSLTKSFRFVGLLPFRVVSLACVTLIAFGCVPGWQRRCCVYLMLSLALSGAAEALGSGGAWTLAASAGLVLLLGSSGFFREAGNAFVPVEIGTPDGIVKFSALRDTGNTLRDPVSGEPVTVVGGKTARLLSGLTASQLADPVSAMAALKRQDLRLIPYRTVGKASGMLLAKRFNDVRIGGRRGSGIIAFAAEGLDEETCQALVGGMA